MLAALNDALPKEQTISPLCIPGVFRLPFSGCLPLGCLPVFSLGAVQCPLGSILANLLTFKAPCFRNVVWVESCSGLLGEDHTVLGLLQV